jgi:spermidine synthase
MIKQVVETASTRHGNFGLYTIQTEGVLHHELYINDQLLTSTQHTSGQILANLALSGISLQQKHADVLIGGLGLGVTLRHVLQHPAVKSVCVVEISPQVISWNRNHLNNVDLLDDPRLELVIGDFCDYAQGAPRSYHGIALHIDAGPNRLARSENRRVYSLSMLKVLQMRLRSDGALSIWAQHANEAYERALKEIFEHMHIETVHDQEANGEFQPCVIYQVRL